MRSSTQAQTGLTSNMITSTADIANAWQVRNAERWADTQLNNMSYQRDSEFIWNNPLEPDRSVTSCTIISATIKVERSPTVEIVVVNNQFSKGDLLSLGLLSQANLLVEDVEIDDPECVLHCKFVGDSVSLSMLYAGTVIRKSATTTTINGVRGISPNMPRGEEPYIRTGIWDSDVRPTIRHHASYDPAYLSTPIVYGSPGPIDSNNLHAEALQPYLARTIINTGRGGYEALNEAINNEANTNTQ